MAFSFHPITSPKGWCPYIIDHSSSSRQMPSTLTSIVFAIFWFSGKYLRLPSIWLKIGMPLTQLRVRLLMGRGTSSSLCLTLPWQSPILSKKARHLQDPLKNISPCIRIDTILFDYRSYVNTLGDITVQIY